MIDLVLCASGSDEVRIVHGLAHQKDHPIRVVRRCADLTETLAVTAAGIGDVVLIDLAVRGVGRETLGTLMRDAAVVGLQAEDATERTRLGLRHVLPSSAPVEEVITVVTAVLDTDDAAPAEWVQDASSCAGSSTGRMAVVWGPSGGTGRSTVAVNLAAEAALAGTETVLVDADTCGPSLSQMLGVLDETPGLVAAFRAHDRDTLDERTLHALLPLVQPGLRLLSGIGVPARWAELQRSSLDGLWQMLTGSGDLVIVDVGPMLEEDEELSYDTVAPQRNAAAVSSIQSADAVIAVVTADPVAITRLLRDHARLVELGVQELHVIVNRVGAPVPGGRIRDLIVSRIPEATVHLLPDDPVACRGAAWDGALLAEDAARSPLRRSLRDIATSPVLLGELAAAPG